DTHTHADHLSASKELSRKTGAKTAGAPAAAVRVPLGEGSVLRVGNLAVAVWASPGHTADSLVFLLPGRVLSADTLLIGATGRTDLPTGEAEQEWASVQRLLTPPAAAAGSAAASTPGAAASARSSAAAGTAGAALVAAVLHHRFHREAALERSLRALLAAAGGPAGSAAAAALVALEALLHRLRHQVDDVLVVADPLRALDLLVGAEDAHQSDALRLPAGGFHRLAQPIQPLAGGARRLADRLVEKLLDGAGLRLELRLGLAFLVGLDLGRLRASGRVLQIRF